MSLPLLSFAFVGLARADEPAGNINLGLTTHYMPDPAALDTPAVVLGGLSGHVVGEGSSIMSVNLALCGTSWHFGVRPCPELQGTTEPVPRVSRERAASNPGSPASCHPRCPSARGPRSGRPALPAESFDAGHGGGRSTSGSPGADRPRPGRGRAPGAPQHDGNANGSGAVFLVFGGGI